MLLSNGDIAKFAELESSGQKERPRELGVIFVVLPRELHPKIIELAIIFAGMYFMLLKFSDYIFCCPYQFESNDPAGR